MDGRVRPSLTLLPLPFAIAFALPAIAQDTDMPPDYGLCPIRDAVPAFDNVPVSGRRGTGPKPSTLPTDVAGDAASGTTEIPVLSGNVELRRGDQFLGADNVTFDTNTDTYVAEGNVRFQDPGFRITAERASGSQGEETHRIEGIHYQLTERRGHGGAERIELQGEQSSLFGSTYTTCPPGEEHWRVVANRIDVDTEEGFAVARNATLRIGKVPVLYVPWFKFPIDERRQTGLLFPSISNSSRNGFDYKQPIYFNLAPNYDLTLSPRIMTSRGVALGSEFRYLNDAGAGTLRALWMPKDKLRDRDRGFVNFGAYQNLTRHWQARANVMWISDPRYFEDFNNSSMGVSAYSAFSEVGLYGRGRYWDAGLTADHWQLADYTLTNASLPYDRLPRAYFNWEQPFGSLLRLGLESELVRFQHSSYRNINADYQPFGPRIGVPGGSRIDLKPYVTLPLEGAGWFVRPTVAWRYTGYQLDDALANQIATSRAQAAAVEQGIPYSPAMDAAFLERNPSRSLPIYSVDAGLQFDREFQRKGEGFVQTLEPRVFYVRSPYRDQSMLPLFDTVPLTFGWGQLFRDNRYSSADRQSDANQFTTAVTTRILRDRDGFEKFNASLGQIHYLEDMRVTAYPWETPVEKGRSAWVADANWAPSDRWLIGASYQWDPKGRRQDLASFRARYLLKDDGIVNLAYRHRRNPLYNPQLPFDRLYNNPDLIEQADLSFLYPINPTWSLVGRYYYSIKDRKALETVAGVQWDSCCIAVRLVGRQYIHNREGDLNDSIMLEIEFKGLGSAGQDTRRTLRRAILGYYRDDLYLVPPPSITNAPADPEPDPTTP